MPDQPAAVMSGTIPAGRLEPDVIGVTQDTVIGMASSSPTATMGLTLAALAAAAAYGSGPAIVLMAVPMLIIANTYRRLNHWNANCSASFEWVGRAINPYLGFLAGWLMITAYVIGTVAGVIVLAPSVLAIFGDSTGSTTANIGIATAVVAVMLIIAIIGIRITAQTQVGMAVVEYVILVGFAIAGLIAVLHHHPGTLPVTRGWLSPTGIGGHGSLTAGFLIAVFMYGGWEGGIYLNEEAKQRRTNPGRAVMWAVALLAGFYALAQVGLQGAVSPARLQDHATSALIYASQALAGSGWAKVMALSLALSVIASTGTGIVILARIIYGMAARGTLPAFLGSVSRRYATPVAASLAAGVILTLLTWLYLLASSVQGAFTAVVNVSGLLFAGFYILTALAAVAYYRRHLLSRPRDAVTLGVLPLAASAFLAWVVIRSLQTAPASQLWSVAGIMTAGLLVMLAARFGLRSPFFALPRESHHPAAGAR